MNQPNPSVKSLLDLLASEIQARLLTGHNGDARISWGDKDGDRVSSDLMWWSWSLSIDPACRLIAGASSEAWQGLCSIETDVTAADLSGESLAPLTGIIQGAASSRFGSEVTCTVADRSEQPHGEWTSAFLAIETAAGSDLSIHFCFSPDLEGALGEPAAATTEGFDVQKSAAPVATTRDFAAILLHVEMPVTIVLGRTKMRLKDLLKLTNGSVVELDQALDDEVEIRVNNCVIAYGQLVAVDGNYAVRVLRMAATRNTTNLSGTLSEKAA